MSASRLVWPGVAAACLVVGLAVGASLGPGLLLGGDDADVDHSHGHETAAAAAGLDPGAVAMESGVYAAEADLQLLTSLRGRRFLEATTLIEERVASRLVRLEQALDLLEEPSPERDLIERTHTALSEEIGQAWQPLTDDGTQAGRDETEVLSSGRILPGIVEGEFAGLRVTNLREGGFLSEIGIREGDLIAQINDLAIDGPEAASEALTSLARSSQLTLTVLRADGGVDELVYP